MGITMLLDLIGGVSLLLWGLHMVQSGVMRAFCARIKIWLGLVLKHSLNALLVGIGVTTTTEQYGHRIAAHLVFIGRRGGVGPCDGDHAGCECRYLTHRSVVVV